MPYSRVTRTAYGADAIAYARGHGRGHHGAESRSILTAGVNMLPDSVMPFEKQMQKYWDRADPRHTTQIDRFVISFHPDELDPDNPKDCQKALDIGCTFARENAPYCQSAVFVRADGRGRKLHIHINTNDVRMDNCKGVDKVTYHHPEVRAVVDKICSRYFELKSAPEPERVTQAVRGRRMINERIRAENAEEFERARQEDRLPDRTKIKQAAILSADEKEFAERLRRYGVELVPCKLEDGTMGYRRPATKRHPEKYYTYELIDVQFFEGKEGAEEPEGEGVQARS